jgi:hypothetical protein
MSVIRYYTQRTPVYTLQIHKIKETTYIYVLVFVNWMVSGLPTPQSLCDCIYMYEIFVYNTSTPHIPQNTGCMISPKNIYNNIFETEHMVGYIMPVRQ